MVVFLKGLNTEIRKAIILIGEESNSKSTQNQFSIPFSHLSQLGQTKFLLTTIKLFALFLHLKYDFKSKKNSRKVITRKLINDSMTYTAYRQLVDDLYENNKTTGENHSASMLNYTKMNIQRMKRLEKKATLKESTLAAIGKTDKKQIWLTLTEGWCGDAAQILPVLDKIVEQNPNIESRYILRDEHLEVMDKFLTNGSRSIPKTIVLDAETLEVLDTWGPRPKELQAYFLAERQKEGYKWANVSIELQRWYNKDKTGAIQQELTELAG